MMQPRPEIAVLTSNALTGIGLKTVLEKIIPTAEVCIYSDFDAFSQAGPERFFHFFVDARLFPAHAAFFRARRRKIILLTDSRSRPAHAGMHTLNVFTSEERLVRDILQMHCGAHGHIVTPAPEACRTVPLTDRETEVLTLVARGYINKQIADELGIGLTTVITHRRNLMEKLGVRSVAELILRAVTAGYVDAEQL